jgi:Flp pilus assembly protein TadG
MTLFRSLSRRRAATAVIVALSLTVLLGVAAITIDGGTATTERRHAQTVADASARAAAADLFAHFATNNGTDPSGTAQASALTTAAANGYANDGVRSIVTVRISPQPPVQADPMITQAGLLKSGYVEVTVQYNERRFFSAIWGQSTFPITARAVARGTWDPLSLGMLLLGPTGSGVLSANGNASLTVKGGAVIVDSSDPNAAAAVGNASLTAPEFDFVGQPGFSTTGSAQFNGSIKSGGSAMSDPLASMTPPDPTTLQLRNAGGLNLSGGNPVTLSPGVYQGGIQISGQGDVTLLPGIYYLQGGGLSITGQGAVKGDGVMIYNASGGAINLAGQGSLNLSPITTAPYQGITIFQDRTSAVGISIKGNGSTTISGAVYAASAALTVSGNGSGDLIASQFIGAGFSLNGNGSFTIDANGPIARSRQFGLVE